MISMHIGLFLISASIVITNCANILVVIPFTSKSHYIFNRVIGLELAKKGHNVTVITTNAEDDPPANYEEIVTEKISDFDKKAIMAITSVFDHADVSFINFNNFMWRNNILLSRKYFESPKVKAFLADNTRKYDLVVSENFFNEATFMFAHKYNAPLVLLLTLNNCMRSNFLTGNPLLLPYVHHQFSDLAPPFTLWEKVKNTFYFVYEIVVWKYWYIIQQEEIAKEFFHNLPQPVPSLEDLHRNAALTFINSNSQDLPRPVTPDVIKVGGLQLQNRKSILSQDLKEILDNAKQGVVFLSYGSNVKCEDLPKDKLEAYIKAFSRLKQTVLFKWEGNDIENKPPNVILRPWFPQFDILGHPNVKVFMSHGGLFGHQEAISFGVPILSIPIYGDQHYNAKKAADEGYGKHLSYQDTNEDTLVEAIEDLIYNETYRIKAKEMYKKFSDTQSNTIESVIYWIEFVIRHKGTDIIRSPSRDSNYVENYLLDVLMVLFFVILILTIIISASKKLICSSFCSKLNK